MQLVSSQFKFLLFCHHRSPPITIPELLVRLRILLSCPQQDKVLLMIADPQIRLTPTLLYKTASIRWQFHTRVLVVTTSYYLPPVTSTAMPLYRHYLSINCVRSFICPRAGNRLIRWFAFVCVCLCAFVLVRVRMWVGVQVLPQRSLRCLRFQKISGRVELGQHLYPSSFRWVMLQ